MTEREDLNSNKTDILISASNSIFGAIPIVGPLISEIVSHTIPNQRIDRLTKYCLELENKLSDIPKEIIETLKTNEQFIDLIEEGFVQASRAISDKRRSYIASIIANGISDSALELDESKYLLKLLQELSDAEIIWLRYYLVAAKGQDEEFQSKHSNIISPIHAHMGSDDTSFDKAAIQDSYKFHLERLKLIDSKIKFDRKTGTPDFDKFTGRPKTTSISTTRFGKLLLNQIGLNDDFNKTVDLEP